MRKFNKNQVCGIRHAVNIENKSAGEVATKYKSSPSTIRRIASGDTYSDVPMPRAILGNSNYIAYPNNKIWSANRNKFLRASAKKSSSKSRYFNLRSVNGERRSIRTSEVSSMFFWNIGINRK